MDYSDAIATLKQADPVLGAVIDQVGECGLAAVQQSGDLLACVSRAIVYQQLSGKAAAAIHQRWLRLYPAAPTAQEILDTPDEGLRGAGLSRAKAAYLRDLAQRVQDGLPSLEALAELDDEAIVQTLLPIKGVGRWTVQMLLIFRLHRWDVLPVDDLGVRAGVRRVYGLSELPTPKQVAQRGLIWQPYRSIATWYLWRSLELV